VVWLLPCIFPFSKWQALFRKFGETEIRTALPEAPFPKMAFPAKHGLFNWDRFRSLVIPELTVYHLNCWNPTEIELFSARSDSFFSHSRFERICLQSTGTSLQQDPLNLGMKLFFLWFIGSTVTIYGGIKACMSWPVVFYINAFIQLSEMRQRLSWFMHCKCLKRN
jgi:hypothetical protein